MNRNIVLIVTVVVAIIASVAVGIAIDERLPEDRSAATDAADRSEFMFQVGAVKLDGRPTQTTNLFFSYRYNHGLADGDIPDYRTLRTAAVDYLNGLDTSEHPKMEILNKALCSKLKADFPVEAISCQMQALHEDSGSFSAVYTIGDISPLKVLGEPAG